MVFSILSALLFIAQEILIFPVLLAQIVEPKPHPATPAGITELNVSTSDGETINIWTSLGQDEKPAYAAIIFHGNGETVARGNFLPFFRSLGIPAFTFDYRGYGRSSGWPSESGLYRDSDAVWEEVQRRTGLDSSRIILLGNSIGSGPASYLAEKIKPRVLVLLAAFADFPSLIAQKPIYSFFRFVLRYNFPVAERVAGLDESCVVIAHGERDTVVPFSHAGRIAETLPQGANFKMLTSSEAEHNDIFYKVEAALGEAVSECLSSNKPLRLR